MNTIILLLAMTAGSFVQVQPPKKPIVQQAAEALGLLPGLTVDVEDREYRCSNCNEMQRPGSLEVMVPDSVSLSNSPEEIIETCRRQAYNGTGSGWCVSCAYKLGRPIKSRLLDAEAFRSQILLQLQAREHPVKLQ
jgi:hypothetical protein